MSRQRTGRCAVNAGPQREPLRDKVRAARAGTPAAAPPAEEDNAGRELTPVRAIMRDLHKMAEQFRAALPKGIEPEQLVRDAISAIRTTRGLLPDGDKPGADHDTILGAVMTCAQLGLRPGVLGEAYVLPFYDKHTRRTVATFVAGYKGFAKLAHQSRQIRGLAARTVYANDRFTLEYRHDGDLLIHTPELYADRGEPRLYYARALLPEGGYQLTEPTRHADMIAHRDQFVKITSGPWFDLDGPGFQWMAWKTEVKRLVKLLPLSPHLAAAVYADEGVRSDRSPNADIEKVTEHPTPPATVIAGEWADVTTVQPPEERP